MAWIAFLLLGLILLFIYSVTKPSANELSAKTGVGVIERRFQRDGYFQFYVEFVAENGEKHLGKTESYIVPKDKYYKGDTVNIQYFFTSKGRPRVKINEPDIRANRADFKKTRKIILTASVLTLILACFSFVMQVVL